MSIGFQTEKKQEMPSKSPDDGDEVMRRYLKRYLVFLRGSDAWPFC